MRLPSVPSDEDVARLRRTGESLDQIGKVGIVTFGSPFNACKASE